MKFQPQEDRHEESTQIQKMIEYADLLLEASNNLLTAARSMERIGGLNPVGPSVLEKLLNLCSAEKFISHWPATTTSWTLDGTGSTWDMSNDIIKTGNVQNAPMSLQWPAKGQ